MDKREEIEEYLKIIRPISLKEEEKLKLIEKSKNGDKQAETEIIRAHIELVVKIAKKYSNQFVSDFLDLIQEGVIGLMRGIPKFDPGKKILFSYYITFWVKAYIIKEVVRQSRIIGIKSLSLILTNYNKVYNQIFQKTGKKPDMLEISEKIGIPVERIKEALKRNKETQCVSSDSPLKGIKDRWNTGTPENIIFDQKSVDPITEIWKKEFIIKIQKILFRLTPKKKKVIEMHLMMGEYNLTIKEIVNEFKKIGVNNTGAGIRLAIKSALKDIQEIIKNDGIDL